MLLFHRTWVSGLSASSDPGRQRLRTATLPRNRRRSEPANCCWDLHSQTVVGTSCPHRFFSEGVRPGKVGPNQSSAGPFPLRANASQTNAENVAGGVLVEHRHHFPRIQLGLATWQESSPIKVFRPDYNSHCETGHATPEQGTRFHYVYTLRSIAEPDRCCPLHTQTSPSSRAPSQYSASTGDSHHTNPPNPSTKDKVPTKQG
jgi:hypothetical protein